MQPLEDISSPLLHIYNQMPYCFSILTAPTSGNLKITIAVDRYPRSDFIIVVEVCAIVTGDSVWKARWIADKTVFENPTLKQTEDKEFRKHVNSYAALGPSFFPLVLG